MNNCIELKPIARIKTDFPSKFAVPRQSGLINELKATVIFEAEYRNADALRGIEDFSHIWLLWGFSENSDSVWSPTVRPPRLGGNTRLGVFATRSPFRPNPIGLSCVKLEKTVKTAQNGTVLIVSGADLVDGTPIYDIKPYIPYTDSHPEASGGFSEKVYGDRLCVAIPEASAQIIGEDRLIPLKKILAGDPRPAYQNDPQRIYGFEFANLKIRFSVNGDTLTVISAEEYTPQADR